MEYTAMRLAHKRSEIQIESVVHYDICTKIADIVKITTEFTISKGKIAFDLIGLCDPWNIAISGNVKNLLELNHIKGWKAYPINVKGVDVKYYLFEVTGIAGMKCKYDSDGDIEYGSIEVDENTLDGSDIFHIGDTGIRVCTSKVKKLIESNKITNVKFIGLENY